MSYTPFNAPLLAGLLGDMEIARFFSVKADLAAMLRFEAELAKAQAQAGLVPGAAATEIASVCASFDPDVMALSQAALRDGMVVPELIRQLRSACTAKTAPHLHFGSTSQDVVDTSLAIRLKQVNAALKTRLSALLEDFEALDAGFGNNTLMARTRMQAALPVTVSHRISQWKDPLQDRLAEFDALARAVAVIQLGGPVGDLASMQGQGDVVRRDLARTLGLDDPGKAWHTDRTCLLAYCHGLVLIALALGKFGTDFALMAQDERSELRFSGAGGSSAMAHKQNPVLAEVLVSQARFVSGLAATMQQAAPHEQERSGTGWTLEWMVLPQICVVTGSALSNARALLASIAALGADGVD